MKLKRVLAGVTALTVLGVITPIPVSAVNNDVESVESTADSVVDTVEKNVGDNSNTTPTTELKRDGFLESGIYSNYEYWTYIDKDTNEPYVIIDLKDNLKDSTTLKGKITVPSTINGYPVKVIECYCFRGCTALTSISIPSTVTTMYDGCFLGCTSLTAVDIPNSVTSWGNNCFYNCSSLPSINIPNRLKNLGDNCFSGCTSLISVTIPDSVISLSGWCFYNCTSLSSVVISEGVKRLGDSCFSNCTSLNSLTLPDSLTHIGNSCFEKCSSLISVNIPFCVTQLGNACFSNCTSLTTISIPYSITDIGDSCFYGCSSLKSINIPYGVTHLSNCFQNCSSLTSVSLPNGITNLDNHCFAGCSSLTDITIPDSVISLSGSCFTGCSSLTSVIIPNNVTSLGNWFFSGCSSLTSVTIPDSVTSLGWYCFDGCSSLTSVSIPDDVTDLGVSFFRGCKSLTSVTIPNSVTSFGQSCFADCSSLKSIKIPNGVTILEKNCFSGCNSLTSVEIPDGVTDLKEYCFSGCSSLTNVQIPDSVTSFGEYCFAGCSSLDSVTLPDNIYKIPSSCFVGCSSLTSVIIPTSVRRLDSSCFAGCSSLTSVTIPGNVTDLGNYCFSGCTALERIDAQVFCADNWNSIFSPITEMPNLKSITLGNNWTNYSTLDGVLFTKDKTTLIGMPQKYETAETYILDMTNDDINNPTERMIYVVPENVTNIDANAFYNISNNVDIVLIDPGIENNSEAVISIDEKAFFSDKTCSEKIIYTNIKDLKPASSDWKVVNVNELGDETKQGEGTFTVYPIDAATGKPVTNAIVTVSGHNYAAKTDETGAAVFSVPLEDKVFWENTHDFIVAANLNAAAENVSISEIPSAASKASASSEAITTAYTADKGSATAFITTAAVQKVSYPYDGSSTTNNSVSFDMHGGMPLQSFKTHEFTDEAQNKALGATLKNVPEGTNVTLCIKESKNSTPVDVMSSQCTKVTGNITKVIFDNADSAIYSRIMMNRLHINGGSRLYLKIDGYDEYYELGIYMDVVTYGEQQQGIFDIQLIKNILKSPISHSEFDSESLEDYEQLNELTEVFNKVFKIKLKTSLLDRKVEASIGLPLLDDEEEETLEQKEQAYFEKYFPEEFKTKYHGSFLAMFSDKDLTLADLKIAQGQKDMNLISSYDHTPKGLKAEATVIGTAIGQIKDTADEQVDTLNISADLAVRLGFKTSHSITFPQLAHLAYITLGIEAEAAGTAGISTQYNMSYKNNKFDISNNGELGFSGDISGQASAIIHGGVGIEDTIDAGIEGKLTGNAGYDFINDTFKDTYFSGDASVYANLLTWNYKQELGNIKYTLFDENGNYVESNKGLTVEVFGEQVNSSITANTKNTTPQMITADDFTLRRRQTYTPSSDINAELKEAIESTVTETAYANVYSGSEPIIINVSGTEYMFRFVDNTQRAVVNGSMLVYSKKTNGVWGDYTVVCDNTTADYWFDVCADGTDIYVAWTDISKELSDSDKYTEAFANSRIAVAKINASDEITVLGTASVPSLSAMTPSISVKNGIGIVAWLANAEYDILTRNGNDQIYYSPISSGALSTPVKYAQTAEGFNVNFLETGYLNNSLNIVYSTIEAQGLPNTSEIFGSVYTSSPVQLTTNTMTDTRPQIAKLNGKDVLYWYRGEDIVYSETLGGAAVTAVENATTDRFIVASDNDVTKIAWCDKDENETNILKMSEYENGSFGSVYVGNNLGRNPSMISGLINSEGNIQVVYTCRNGSDYDIVVTKETDNNTARINSVIVDSDYIYGEGAVPLTVNVSNTGNRKLDSLTFNVTDNSGTTVATFTSNEALDINEEKSYTFNADIPAITDTSSFNVSISDYGQNTKNFAVGYTELRLDGESFSAGGNTYVHLTCENLSAISADAIITVFVDDKLMGVTSVEALDPSSNRVIKYNITEIAGNNDFTTVKFVISGNKQDNSITGTSKTFTYEKSENTEKPIEAAKPSITKAAAGDGKVALNWTAVDGAEKYAVYTYLDGKYTCVGSRASTVTGMYVTGLTNGTTYGFLVRAYVNGAWTSFTADDIVYAAPVGEEKPVAVTKPSITKAAAGDGKVALNWTAVDGAEKYAVYTYLDGKYTCVGSRASTVTGMYVTGLTNGTTYGFLVRAYVNGAWTSFTADDIVYAAPVGEEKPVEITKPSITKATPGDGKVALNWTAVDGAEKYAVYTYLDGKYTCVGSRASTVTGMYVTGLTNGTTYGFLVRAYVNGAWTSFTSDDIVYAAPIA